MPMTFRFRYILWGLIFAVSGEIFDNFIANSRPLILLPIIIILYSIFFLLAFQAYRFFEKRGYSIRTYCLVMGIFGLLVIENILLGKITELWPIQILMFSWWFSIVSYPFVMMNKKKTVLLIPFVTSISGSMITILLAGDMSLAINIFQFLFWIISAIMNFSYMKS